MASVPNPNLGSEHLSECQLLAYLDSELSRAEVEKAKAHLKLCWSCRSNLNRMEENIENFLDARSTLMPHEDPFSDLRVEQFRQRLMRHASASEQPAVPLYRRCLAALARRTAVLGAHRQAAIAALVIVCLVVFMFTDSLNTRVSADTVLQQAEKFEQQHAAPSGQVLRTNVRLDRIDRLSGATRQLGTISLVRDSATPSVYVTSRSNAGEVRSTLVSQGGSTERVLRPLFQQESLPVENYLEQQMWLPEVSASEFRQLIGQRHESTSSASKQQQQFELHFPFAAGHPSGIQEATLWVSAADYAPTGVSILTAGKTPNEYRFTRTLSSQEPRTAEIARLFSPEPSETRASYTESRPAAPQLTRPAPLSYRNSKANETEVSVSQALHNVNACLGEEVYIFPMSDGTLLVQGLVDSPARRQAIRSALHPYEPHVRVEVFLARELKSGSELYRPPDDLAEQVLPGSGSNPIATTAELPGATMPLYDKLREHFIAAGKSSEEAEKQVSVYSNELVTSARQTFLHAWALKRLEGEFSADRTDQLSPTALSELDKLRQDHRRWIATLTQHQAEMLQEVLPESAAGLKQQVHGAADTDTLLRLAHQQNELVRSLFTPSQQHLSTDIGLQHLVDVLRRMGA